MLVENNTINRRFAFCKALFFMVSLVVAQPNYFQQEVNYKMVVKLNDVNHSLQAKSEIQYINNSAEDLSFIYFHLWPNAYRDNNSALAKQLLQQANTKLYFSKPEERGFIDSLDFKVNNEKIHWKIDSTNSDICKLYLNKPLKPNESIIITTPFYVKLPDAIFSRLGHTNQAYFITQWYPKPAVYDREGWHPMPYLDQGEFYSEFGSFDVSITLPENYLLAATGDRMEAKEEELFLNETVAKTLEHIKNKTQNEAYKNVPESSPKYKTVKFKQAKVHDFAWFANKQFYVMRDSVELPESKRKVTTWTFFTPDNYAIWQQAINYVNESTLFYSKLLGDYPYNQVTAIDGTIMAGGGMEYPNITVISNASTPAELDVTIAHEVGHNWFYGILGNNERRYPFMDEGLNSYYEMCYLRTKYPFQKLSYYIGQDSTFKFLGLNKYPYWKDKELAYIYSARQHNDQAMNLAAQDYTGNNYGSIIYSKVPVVLDYLASYMGEARFNAVMKQYYEQFKFKHPTPNDLFNVLSEKGQINLDVFKTTLVESTKHINYKISSVKKNKSGSYQLQLKNKTGVALPFEVVAIKNGATAETRLVNGFDRKSTVTFTTANADYFKIDGDNKLPDINRRNNTIKAKGMFKKYKALQINFLTKLDDPSRTQINVFPAFGNNVYNGFMPGMIIHNYSLFRKRVEYFLVPQYGTKTKSITGFGEINLNFFPEMYFSQITLGALIKTYSYDKFVTDKINQVNSTNFKNLIFNYIKVAPYLEFDLKNKKPTSPLRQLITLTSNVLITDSLNTSYEVITKLAAIGPQKRTTTSFIQQIDYELKNKRVINPYQIQLSVQQAGSMAKVFGKFNYVITISEKNFMEIGGFAGAFLSGNSNERGYYAFRASGYNGYQDYNFNGNFLARNGGSDFGNSQFLETDGNIKVPVILRNSSDWMLSFNVKSPKLFVFPLRFFADVLICDARSFKNEKWLWDLGVNLTLKRDYIEIYIPFAYSAYIKNVLDLNKIDFYNRVRFTFNIHKLVPRKVIRNKFL